MEIQRGVRCFRRIDNVLVLDGADMKILTPEGLDDLVRTYDSSLRRVDGISPLLPGGGIIFRAYSNNRARSIADHLVKKGLTQGHIIPLR